jgi:antitoxin CptB
LNSDRNAETRLEQRERLRWRCRRGLRELDILLLRFLDEVQTAGAPDDLVKFERLLSYPDDVLLGLLTGRMMPPDKDLADVVDNVRKAAARNA